MRALIRDRYGPPDVLEVREVERPVPKEREVLVRVHAASINDWDWGLPLFRASQPLLSSTMLYRTISATLHTAVSSHSISIGPASAATTSGFLLAA